MICIVVRRWREVVLGGSLTQTFGLDGVATTTFDHITSTVMPVIVVISGECIIKKK